MNDIKRYFISPIGPNDACEEWEDKHGEWVHYADHKAEVERLEARVRELEADPRLTLTKEDLALGLGAAGQAYLITSSTALFGSPWGATFRRYQEAVDAVVAGEGGTESLRLDLTGAMLHRAA